MPKPSFVSASTATANHGHGLRKFDKMREKKFHDLTNDASIAMKEDKHLRNEAKQVERQNKLFKEARLCWIIDTFNIL